jgi:unsaturated chondroitin disaccharide hydrolase
MKKSSIYVVIACLILWSCNPTQNQDDIADVRIEHINQQLGPMVEIALNNQQIPRTIHEGKLRFVNKGFDWTEGFFPGTCWYMYELNGDDKWRNAASSLQELFIDHRFRTTNHDLGFVFYCSFGHGYKLQLDDKSKGVLIDAANSLITRFNPAVGCILSWDVDKGWQSERGWQFPVIIDNMMNLELLFEVSKLTGDKKYYTIANTHAQTTLKNHFRDDGSSYHVIDYDSINGDIRNRHTAQGFAHESAWARGQAWGLYGFTLSYRYTKDEKFLKKAEEIANFILNHPNLPKDKVPYWDFNAPNIPDEYRDASAAAIIASALIELDDYSSNAYKDKATDILNNLSSDKYLAKVGENHNFLLKHSVGSIPHGNEIDVPLNFADYYYTEAIYRLSK